MKNWETLIFELLQKIVGKLGKPGGNPDFGEMAENCRKSGKMEGCKKVNKNGVNLWDFGACPKISKIYILTSELYIKK